MDRKSHCCIGLRHPNSYIFFWMQRSPSLFERCGCREPSGDNETAGRAPPCQGSISQSVSPPVPSWWVSKLMHHPVVKFQVMRLRSVCGCPALCSLPQPGQLFQSDPPRQIQPEADSSQRERTLAETFCFLHNYRHIYLFSFLQSQGRHVASQLRKQSLSTSLQL